jgi:hypothetical protein
MLEFFLLKDWFGINELPAEYTPASVKRNGGESPRRRAAGAAQRRKSPEKEPRRAQARAARCCGQRFDATRQNRDYANILLINNE